jgi:cell division protein FtsW
VRRGRLQKQSKTIDKKLLVVTLLLAGLGLLAVADASAPQALSTFSDKFYFVKQQAVWLVIGFIVMFLATKIHYSFWEKIATPLFILSILFLVAVLIPGIGSKLLGARRWIVLGPVVFQPSEIIKLTLALFLAKAASKNKSFLLFFGAFALVAALIMLEPDLGTTIIITVLSLAQIFVSGINIFHFIGAGILVALSSLVLIIVSPYRRERLMTFLKVAEDPLGKDYHIRQVLLALGSGGLLGVGLGQSRQKFLFLPEAATDSIFAVVAEEMGFIGALVLILLFGFFIWQGFRIARKAPDKFSQILSVGIMAWIGGQIMINIGSMVALVPLTGIPLPFFSYGGSSLVMVLFATGILLNVSKHTVSVK